MKNGLLPAAFVVLHLSATAQCTNCNSLTEALRDPARVIHLDLSNQGLRELPDSIRFMTQLETIDLSENFFTTIDLKGAQLPNVYQLNLTGNIGLDPLELHRISSAFPNLMNLTVSHCRLAYLTPDIATFNQLIALDLSENSLVSLPEELKDLKQLNVLNISSNDISDITYVLSNCWNLRKLNAARNPFDVNALLISVGTFEKLEHLTWSPGELNRDGAAALAELPLRSMEITDVKGQPLPAALMRNPYISELTLTDCSFKGDICTVIGGMANLDQLTLNHTAIPEKLPKVTQLSTLTLADVPYPPNNLLTALDFLDELDVTLVDVPDSVTRRLPELMKNTTVRTSYFNYAPDMIRNTVPVITAASAVAQQIPGDKPVQIVVETLTLDIPEKAFLNADGSVYSGEVTVRVTNYDNAINNALSGAPMMISSNGQNEVFASAGMLDFRAADASGNELQANPASQIQVTMVNQRPDANSNLYTFDEQTRQWMEALAVPAKFDLDSMRTILIDSINRLDLNRFVRFQSIPTPFALQIRDKRLDPATLDFTYMKTPRQPGFDRRTMSLRYYEQNRESKLIANRTWRIDTIVTPALMDKLMEIQCIKKSRRSDINYDNAPRPIQDLKVVPDFENDNYRLSFRYKDTLMSIPVFLETAKKGRSVMTAYAAFQKSLNRAIRNDERMDKGYKARKQAGIRNMALQARDLVINDIQNGNPARLEQLRFGLPFFGLVNCDFFSRNPPDLMSGLSDTLTDQNGQSIGSPEFVRTILPNSNVYLSSGREQIPQYASEKTILLLLISATEIGLIKLENLLEKGKIRSFSRFDIKGKSPEEVAHIISEF